MLREGLDRVFPAWSGLAVAGRTDAGVHALGQVASLEVEGGPPLEHAAEALNAVLPGDVAVVAAAEAPPGFHARFSARSRSYRYRINRRATPSPFEARRSWWLPQPLDEERPARRGGAPPRRARLPRVHADRDPARGVRPRRRAGGVAARRRRPRVRDHRGQLPPPHGAHARRDDGRARARASSPRCSTGAPREQAGRTAPPWGLYLVGVAYDQEHVKLPVVLFDLDGTVIDSGGIILASMRHAATHGARARLLRRGADGGGRRPGPRAPDARARPRRGSTSSSPSTARTTRRCTRACCRAPAWTPRSSSCKREGRTARHRHREAPRRPSSSRSSMSRSATSSTSSSAATRRSATSPTPSPCCSRLERLGARAEEAAYVGDSPFDVAAGKAAGVFTRRRRRGAASTTASGSRREQPDAVVDTAGGAPCRPRLRRARPSCGSSSTDALVPLPRRSTTRRSPTPSTTGSTTSSTRSRPRTPELVTPDSPTQRVGAPLSDRFQKVRHLAPMGSLEKVTTDEARAQVGRRRAQAARLGRAGRVRARAEDRRLGDLRSSTRTACSSAARRAATASPGRGRDAEPAHDPARSRSRMRGDGPPARARGARRGLHAALRLPRAQRARSPPTGERLAPNPRNASAGSLRQKDSGDHRAAAALDLGLRLRLPRGRRVRRRTGSRCSGCASAAFPSNPHARAARVDRGGRARRAARGRRGAPSSTTRSTGS